MVNRCFFPGLGILAVFLYGCAIDPAAVSPSSSAVSHLCTTGLPAHAMNVATSAALVSSIQTLQNRRTTVLNNLPSSIQGDKVIASVLDLMIAKKGESAALFAEHTAAALALNSDVVQQLAKSRPTSLHNRDFKALYKKLISPNGATSSSRLIAYESAYFNGKFYDRFGTGLPKPTLSLTVTDQEISGALTSLVEALADDLFSKSPVWKDSNNHYFPGDSANEPTFLTFPPGAPPTLETLATDGCGMTKLKADTLTYLAGKASTWAAGETGFVMGNLGGINAGPVFVLGKFSIGDNKTLQTVAQTILAEAAKRATMEAVKDVLLEIDQPSSWASVDDVLNSLVFGKSG